MDLLGWIYLIMFLIVTFTPLYVTLRNEHQINKDRKQAIARLNNMYKNNDLELIEIVEWEKRADKQLDTILNLANITRPLK